MSRDPPTSIALVEETSRITEELESAVNLSDPVAMSNWLKDAGNLFLAGLKEQVIKVEKIKFDFCRA